MGNPLQGFPLPPRLMRERSRVTRRTGAGVFPNYEKVQTTDPWRQEKHREFRLGEPLPCGHVVTKRTPYLGTCSVCRITEFCARCELRCNRCSRIVFHCCAVLYSTDDTTEVYYCQPCQKIVRRRYLLGLIGDALKQPFIAEPPPDDSEP